MNGFQRLLSPLILGSHTVRNRVVLTAHGEHLAADGIVTDALIGHYERRAAGGVGLIITGGSAAVSPESSNPALISLWDPRNDGPLATLAERVHQLGAVVLCQASHRATRELPPQLDAMHVAPSAGASVPPYGAPAVLTESAIAKIVQCYADAAVRLARAGFDGIEVTALGTHLIEQFWSPVLNRRTDRYGGSLVNRMRFGREVINAVAATVPQEFLVAFRMSADEGSKNVGLAPDDLMEIATLMGELQRISFFDIAGGSGLSVAAHAAAVPTDDFPVKCNNDHAMRIRKQVHVPVLVAGRILTPESAEQTLASGAADLVGMTRALLADPDVPRRAAAGEADRIRPCIAINEGCRRVTANKSLACTVNPEVGASEVQIRPAGTPRRVMVVGGGPAGMEAARVAALRNHRVVLFEAQRRFGGQVRMAAQLPNRPHLDRHVLWLERELELAGVQTHLGAAVTADLITEHTPDALIVATGCESFVPEDMAQGFGRAVTDVDVLDGRVELPVGARILVYDAEGHVRGPALACMAAVSSHVDYVTPFPTVGHNLEAPNKPATMRRVRASSVMVHCDTQLFGEQEGLVYTRDVWTEEQRDISGRYDLAIVVGFRESSTSLDGEILVAGFTGSMHRIGDAKAPRLLRNAISEGVRIGVTL